MEMRIGSIAIQVDLANSTSDVCTVQSCKVFFFCFIMCVIIAMAVCEISVPRVKHFSVIYSGIY